MNDVVDLGASPLPSPSLANAAPLARAEHLDFWYGEGEGRFQVLFDINFEILPGQLVVMTGPSGSGKTTLLTLIGALRSLQQTVISFALTLGMCLVSAALAIRRVIAVDPAEVF